MAEAYIYDQDCKDFANIGLCGRLSESLCEFEEVANGMAELTMEHPIDDDGRYLLLVPGRIIKASVPVRNIPELDGETHEWITAVERWYVRNDATKLQRSVYNKRDDQVTAAKERADSSEDKTKYDKKRLRVLKKGTRVTVLRNYGDLYPEYRIRVGKTTGYIDKTALRDGVVYEYEASISSESLDGWLERLAPSWRTKEQLFRIYSVVRDDDKVVVHARHIFFDNAYTLTTYENTGNPSISTVLTGIENNRCGQCLTDFWTNIQGTQSGAHYENKNIVEAILDPDEGVAHRWGADVIRDNYDCYLIGGMAYDRGTTLEYGHDLLGVEYDVNWENIVTHVRPVGETAAGKPLYLTSNKGMVVSQNASNYPFAHVAVLKVNEAKVRKDVMTTAEARTKLQSAANELLAAGCDQPQVSIKVEFTQLGETEEYAAYKDLKQMFLFDMVRVYHKRLNIKAEVQVVRIVWDCRLERMKEVELGSVRTVSPKISSYQIGSVSGTKLSGGSVSAAALDDDSITTRHLQADSVDTRQLVAESVVTAKIAAGAITAIKLDADAVKTKMLDAFNAVIQNIQAGHVAADTIDAAMAYLASLEAGFATFTQAQVTHMVANALNLDGNGTMDDVFIHNLRVAYAQMVSATIGNLCIKASDGNYYTIDVSQGGIVTATQTSLTPEEIAAGETEDHRTIMDTDIVAANLSTSTLLATYALMNRIDAARIDVDTLVARQAFINRLATREIISDDVVRIIAGQGRQAESILMGSRIFRETPEPPYSVNDLWVQGDENDIYVCVNDRADGDDFDADDWTISNAYDAAVATMRDDVSAMIEVDTDGLHVKGQRLDDGQLINTDNEVVVTPEGVNVVVSGEPYSRFAANYAQFGKYRIKRTADDGLAFKFANDPITP